MGLLRGISGTTPGQHLRSPVAMHSDPSSNRQGAWSQVACLKATAPYPQVATPPPPPFHLTEPRGRRGRHGGHHLLSTDSKTDSACYGTIARSLPHSPFVSAVRQRPAVAPRRLVAAQQP